MGNSGLKEVLQMRSVLVALVLLFLIAMVGCGGSGVGDGSGNGTITTNDRENDDHSFGDVGHFTATSNTVVVEMKIASQIPVTDPYVVVWSGYADDFTTYTYIGSDDDSGEGPDARFIFYPYPGQSFSVLFTTFGPYDFGGYYWSVRGANTESAPAAQEDTPAKNKLDPAAKHAK